MRINDIELAHQLGKQLARYRDQRERLKEFPSLVTLSAALDNDMVSSVVGSVDLELCKRISDLTDELVKLGVTVD